MSNQKIKFGNFDITIEPRLNYSNAVLYPRKNMAAEFEGLSSYLDKQLSKKHKKQNLKGIKGAGKRYWQVNKREIIILEKISI